MNLRCAMLDQHTRGVQASVTADLKDPLAFHIVIFGELFEEDNLVMLCLGSESVRNRRQIAPLLEDPILSCLRFDR